MRVLATPSDTTPECRNARRVLRPDSGSQGRATAADRLAMPALAASVTPASVAQEGYVWRGSDVFCDIVNLRYAKLYPDVLVTYRKEMHTSPSKAWPLYAGCMLTDVEGRELMFCHRGYNNVFARLSGRFERVEAVR